MTDAPEAQETADEVARAVEAVSDYLRITYRPDDYVLAENVIDGERYCFSNADLRTILSRLAVLEEERRLDGAALERAADDLRDIGTQSPRPSNSADPKHENYLRQVLISLGQMGNARARARLQARKDNDQ